MNRMARRRKIVRTPTERRAFAPASGEPKAMPPPALMLRPYVPPVSAGWPPGRTILRAHPIAGDGGGDRLRIILNREAQGYRFPRLQPTPDQLSNLTELRKEYSHRSAIAKLDEYRPGETGLTSAQIRVLRLQVRGDGPPEEWLAMEVLARMFWGQIPGPREAEAHPEGREILDVLDDFLPGDPGVAGMAFEAPEPYGYRELHAAYWIDRLVADLDGGPRIRLGRPDAHSAAMRFASLTAAWSPATA